VVGTVVTCMGLLEQKLQEDWVAKGYFKILTLATL
jgi:hypothetical protein